MKLYASMIAASLDASGCASCTETPMVGAVQVGQVVVVTGAPVVDTGMVYAVRGDKGEPGVNGVGDLFAPAPAGVDFVAGIDAAWSF